MIDANSAMTALSRAAPACRAGSSLRINATGPGKATCVIWQLALGFAVIEVRGTKCQAPRNNFF